MGFPFPFAASAYLLSYFQSIQASDVALFVFLSSASWHLAFFLEASVTRFDEISPLYHNIKNFGSFERVQLVAAKVLSLLWRILNAVGQILIGEKGKLLKNYLAIWSHCSKPNFSLIGTN